MPYQRRSASLLFLTLLLTTANQTAGAQRRSDDEESIHKLLQAHAVAWNKRDPKAAVAILTPDAVWITSSGQKLVGRAEIERAHVEWFKEDAATGGSTHSHPPETIVIRFLRPDIAVADLDSLFISSSGPDGKQIPPQPSGIFIVVTKTSGTWLIGEVRNTVRPRSQ